MDSGFLVLFFSIYITILFHNFSNSTGNCSIERSVPCPLCHALLLLCTYSLSSNMNKWHLLHCPTFTPSILILDGSRINVLWAEVLISNFLFSARQAYYKISLLSKSPPPTAATTAILAKYLKLL